MTLCKSISASLSELCFPSLCISCEAKIDKGILCPFCSEKIELISTKNRCHTCFEENEGRCFRCIKEKLHPRAFTCENYGPVQSLALQICSNLQIQKNIGSLMVVQLCSLSWPMPDVLIPLSGKEGEAVSLAKQIRAFIPSEVKSIIRKKRFTVDQGSYSVKKGVNLSDKNCLVLSVYGLEEKEREYIAQKLYEAAPKGVYFLSFLP